MIAPSATRRLRQLVHLALICAAGCMRCWPVKVVTVSVSDVCGLAGTEQLDQLELPPAYQHRLDSSRRLIEVFDTEIEAVSKNTRARLRADPGYSSE